MIFSCNYMLESFKNYIMNFELFIKSDNNK